MDDVGVEVVGLAEGVEEVDVAGAFFAEAEVDAFDHGDGLVFGDDFLDEIFGGEVEEVLGGFEEVDFIGAGVEEGLFFLLGIHDGGRGLGGIDECGGV